MAVMVVVIDLKDVVFLLRQRENAQLRAGPQAWARF